MKETSKRIVRVLPGVHEIWPLVTPALTSTSPLWNANRREDVAVQSRWGFIPSTPATYFFYLKHCQLILYGRT